MVQEKSRDITISMEDKPNLRKLMRKDPAKFRAVLMTMIQAAENIADSEREIPWYDVPEMIHENLKFQMLIPAVLEAVLDVKSLNPDSFSVLGIDLHPLSLFQKKGLSSRVHYSKWRAHFGADPGAEITPETVKDILRKLLYYAKYIDVGSFGKALMSLQLEAHKALPLPAVMNLPFYPALRYQQEKFGDLKVGQFWPDVGAFYGGDESGETACPACKTEELKDVGGYKVCPNCNIGFKITSTD